MLQKDTGFDRCISGSTAADDLEPLEDLQDFEARTWMRMDTWMDMGLGNRSESEYFD